jgi:hypothetical protein
MSVPLAEQVTSPDVMAVLNPLWVAFPQQTLTDY